MSNIKGEQENLFRKFLVWKEVKTKMAGNLVDEIKSAEAQAVQKIKEAKAEAVRMLNEAASSSENRIKEARQTAARDFRTKLATAEKEAEAKAVELVSKGEVAAKSFLESNLGKVSESAKVIAEEVMVRYVRS
jgi:V/A-type H+-transporting ATPase subunit G/H